MKKINNLIELKDELFNERLDLIDYILTLSKEEQIYILKDIPLYSNTKNDIRSIRTLKYNSKKILKLLKDVEILYTPLLFIDKYIKKLPENKYYVMKEYSKYELSNISKLYYIITGWFYKEDEITIQNIIDDYEEYEKIIKQTFQEKINQTKEKRKIILKEIKELEYKIKELEKIIKENKTIKEDLLSLKKTLIIRIENNLKNIKDLESYTKDLKNEIKKVEEHINKSILTKIKNKNFNEKVKYIKKIITVEEFLKEQEKYKKRNKVSQKIIEECIYNDYILPSMVKVESY
jgi:hypothetical protein